MKRPLVIPVMLVLAIVAALLATTLSSAPTQANHGNVNQFTSAYLDPTPQSCVVGTPCILDILIHEPANATQSGVTAIAGGISFDPTILQVTSVTGQFWSIDSLTLDNTTGLISYAASGPTVSSNTVVVATITFNPIAAGNSALSFSITNIFYLGFGFFGSNGAAVNGSVTVTGPTTAPKPPPPPPPPPPAGDEDSDSDDDEDSDSDDDEDSDSDDDEDSDSDDD